MLQLKVCCLTHKPVHVTQTTGAAGAGAAGDVRAELKALRLAELQWRVLNARAAQVGIALQKFGHGLFLSRPSAWQGGTHMVAPVPSCESVRH